MKQEGRFYRFAPRFGILGYGLAFLVFLLFLGVFIYVILHKDVPLSGGRTSLLIFLLLFSLFGFLMVLKGLCLAMGIVYYYGLMQNAVVISTPLSKKEIPFNSIRELKRLGPAEVGNLFYSLHAKALSSSKKFSAGDFWESSKAIINLNKYNTDPIGQGYAQTGIGIGQGSHGGVAAEKVGIPIKTKVLKPVVSNQYFILMVLKNGNKYLLSPRNVHGFLEMFKKLK